MKKTKKYEHIIKEVAPGSIGEELEIEVGDVLLAINDQPITDVFDYRFLCNDEYIEVLIRKPDGEEWLLEIDKEFQEDLGLEFENGLMSEYKNCSNKCIFCFIDQMPPGMRETLYFKDDDSRLSFLQGNYITLTNMTETDVDRIIRMQLAPINISVQTTNPDLRCKMLNNRFAGDKLKFLDSLYQGHVEMNGQIVLVKGVNDGAELKRSIEDLSKYLPFMRSVSVVPAGITKFREGLFPIELFTKEEAEEVIDMIESYQQGFYQEYGLHFIHASDEWYILAERDFPEEDQYDGYIQLENGVGMMRLLQDEFEQALQDKLQDIGEDEMQSEQKRVISVATGKLAYPLLCKLADMAMKHFSNLEIQVFCIRNDFFGETITVSGLITGGDLLAQLRQKQEAGIDLGQALLIPINMLRNNEQVFLDDLTVSQIEEGLGIRVKAVEATGQALLEAMLKEDYYTDRNNENFVYNKIYE